MRIARAEYGSLRAYGILLDDDSFVPVAATLEELVSNLSDAIEENDVAVARQRAADDPVPAESYRLLAPCEPSKIVAVGLNYRDHARELGQALPDEPIIFLKPPTSVIGPGDTIVLPPESSRVDYEAELAFVVGKRARRVSEADAPGHILGYTCANDVTARDLQQKDGQWTRAKSFDTFCPLGPWIETSFTCEGKRISSAVNDVLRQDSTLDNLIFKPHELLSFISSVMTLEPGDVVLTGTPAGIGKLFSNDRISVTIDGIGVLANIVSE